MRSIRRRAVFVGLAATLLSVACDTQRIVEVIEDLWASVSPSNAVIRAIGATVQLGVVDAAGAPVTVPGLTWSAIESNVVQVDGTGRAIAVAPGTAHVVAQTSTQADTATIEVRQDVASVTVSPATPSVGVGTTQQLSATLRDPNAHPITGRTVIWSSSAQGIATVNGNGVVTGVAAGSATISATSDGIAGTATVTVTAAPPPPPPPPPPVATVEVSPSSATVVAGQTRQLTVTLRDAGGNALTGRNVTWTTNASGVATVSGNGLVTAQGAGSATITATSEGVSGTSAITVTPVPVATVTVTPASATVEAGQTRQLTATLRDANNNVLTGRSITWTTSASGVATVNGNGLVTAVAAGPATITASSEGISGTAAITVTAAPPPDQTAPSIPQNLVALAVGPTQVNLSWSASTDNVGVTGYRVFRNGTQVGTPTAPAYSDVGLTPNTAYSYTVAAVDAAGNASAQSTAASATTPASSIGGSLPAGLAQSTGTVFYVAPNGANTNPGTLAAPWQTIQKALNTLQAGQKAYVRGGTYREELTMNRAGTAAAPITIEAYPGETPIVDAEHVRRPLVIQSGGGYFRIKGFILDRDCCTSGGHIDVYGHHIEIIGNEMRNGRGKGVYTDPGSRNVHIIGNWIHHNVTSGGQQDHGIYMQGADHLVANNVIHDHPDGFGIQIYPGATRVIVVNNTVTNNAHSGIVVGGDDGVSNVTIRNNILANNSSYGVQHDSRCPTANVVVENNVIFGNGSGGVQGGCSAISASGNITTNPGFVNPGNATSRNLRVQSGSPAINAARADFAMPTAHGGAARDAQPDIGAYEFGTTP